ncbi:hypothetical protein LTR17_005482 [Elasticomyces elasticus]|nr:hypothetical protein LTR17_005482 [Elasticomyces elasticus]
MEAMEDFVLQTHDELITVRVGSGEGLRDFKLPKALLCARVAWFDSALRDERFLEGNTGIITLPEDDPGIFLAVHYYIYNQTLSFAQIPESDGDSTRAKQIAYCIRIWILGHKYCMTGLQNCAMQRACLLLKEKEDESLIDNITLKACFSFTAPYSPLRTLAIDYIVDRTSAQGVQTIGEFNDVFACSDGASVEELFDAREGRGAMNYPLYQSPLQCKDIMYVKDAGTSAQADWNKDIILGTKRGSCKACGIFDGSYHDAAMSRISDFNRHLSSHRVIVEVGKDDQCKTYNIPKDILCTVTWFERALQADAFQEGADGRIALPEDNSAAFDIFQYWLYYAELDFEQIYDDKDAQTDLGRELEHCVGAWIFGHKYGIAGLQNAVMLRACDILMTKRLLLSPECVTACYAHTAAGASLRKLAAENLVYHNSEHNVDIGPYEGASAHGGFVADLLEAQNSRHVAPKDFPRYIRPRVNKTLFYTRDDVAAAATRNSTANYNGSWEPVRRSDCVDCMLYYADTICQSCQDEEGDEGVNSQPFCSHKATDRKCSTCAMATVSFPE